MTTEKRKALRRELRWGGQIVSLDGTVLGECMVLDVSASGAKLILRHRIELPDEFVLYLSKDGKVTRRCEIKRRSEFEVGVQFFPQTSEQQDRLST